MCSPWDPLIYSVLVWAPSNADPEIMIWVHVVLKEVQWGNERVIQVRKERQKCHDLVTTAGTWSSIYWEIWWCFRYTYCCPKDCIFIYHPSLVNSLDLLTFLVLDQSIVQWSRTFTGRNPGSHQHELELSVNILLDRLEDTSVASKGFRGAVL